MERVKEKHNFMNFFWQKKKSSFYNTPSKLTTNKTIKFSDPSALNLFC